MGISGLLGLLAPVTKDVTLEDIRGKVVAVDALCWLHRGCRSCVKEICTNKKTTKYLSFCEKMILLFKRFDITPIMIVDGDSLIAKEKEDTKRKEAREQRLAEGLQLEREGRHSEAYQKFTQAISVSLEMICEFLQMLIRYRIPYIIAPYESDAQMAYLSRTGIVDAVITEDSDTLCYRCPKVLFKMTAEGTSKCIQLKDVYESFADMKNWTPELFELMCVLNGCDYAEGCNRIGLKTAVKLINRGKNMKDILKIIECNPIHKFGEFKPRLEFATSCFHHQVIYNPMMNKREYLTPVPEATFKKFCKNKQCHFGELKTDDIAMKRAKGLISDDQGTILLPPNSNVDYLDHFFNHISLYPVRALFSLPCNKKEEMIDLTELAYNEKSPVVSKSVAVKRPASSAPISECNTKREFKESPTSVIAPTIFDLSFEESITDDLLAEADLIERSICGNSYVCYKQLISKLIAISVIILATWQQLF